MGRPSEGCGEAICRVWVCCLNGVGKLSGECVEAVCMLCGGCLEGCEGYLKGGGCVEAV